MNPGAGRHRALWSASRSARPGPADAIRVLLIDPSSHGGIASYTAEIAKALRTAGGDPALLGSVALTDTTGTLAVERRLPAQPWGRPAGAGVALYARRALAWARSASIIVSTVRRSKPDVVHFQAAINRRFDTHLIRLVARGRPVIWTAHDVLPFERTDSDRGWFAAIYRSVDRVIVFTSGRRPGPRARGRPA